MCNKCDNEDSNVSKDSGDECKKDTEVYNIYELKLLKDFYERLNKLTTNNIAALNKVFAINFTDVTKRDTKVVLGQRFQDWEIEKLHKLNCKCTWDKTIIKDSMDVFNSRYEELSKVVHLKRLVGESTFSKLNKESIQNKFIY